MNCTSWWCYAFSWLVGLLITGSSVISHLTALTVKRRTLCDVRDSVQEVVILLPLIVLLWYENKSFLLLSLCFFLFCSIRAPILKATHSYMYYSIMSVPQGLSSSVSWTRCTCWSAAGWRCWWSDWCGGQWTIQGNSSSPLTSAWAGTTAKTSHLRTTGMINGWFKFGTTWFNLDSFPPSFQPVSDNVWRSLAGVMATWLQRSPKGQETRALRWSDRL